MENSLFQKTTSTTPTAEIPGVEQSLQSPTLSPQEILNAQSGNGAATKLAINPVTERPDIPVSAAVKALNLEPFDASKGLYRYRTGKVDMLVAFITDDDKQAKPNDIIRSMVVGTLDVTTRPFPSAANKADLQASIELVKKVFGPATAQNLKNAGFDLDAIYTKMQNPEEAKKVLNAQGLDRHVVYPVVDLSGGSVLVTRLSNDPRGTQYPPILSFEIMVKKSPSQKA